MSSRRLSGSSTPGIPLKVNFKQDAVDPWLVAMEAKLDEAKRNIEELLEYEPPSVSLSAVSLGASRMVPSDSQSTVSSSSSRSEFVGPRGGTGLASSGSPRSSSAPVLPVSPLKRSLTAQPAAVSAHLSATEFKLQIDEIFAETLAEIRQTWRSMRDAERSSVAPARTSTPAADGRDQQIAQLQAALDKQSKQLADQRAAYYKEILLLREQLSMKEGPKHYTPEEWGRFFEPDEDTLTLAQLVERLETGRGPKNFQAAYELLRQRQQDMALLREEKVAKDIQQYTATIDDQSETIQHLNALLAEKDEEMRKLDCLNQAELMQQCQALSSPDIRIVEQAVWRLSDLFRDDPSRAFKVPAAVVSMMVGFMRSLVGTVTDGLQREKYLDELQEKYRKAQSNRPDTSLVVAQQEAQRLRMQVAVLAEKLDAFARAVAEIERLKAEPDKRETKRQLEQLAGQLQSEVVDLSSQLKSFSLSLTDVERLHMENASLKTIVNQTTDEIRRLQRENKALAARLKKSDFERLPTPLGARPGTSAPIWEFEFEAPVPGHQQLPRASPGTPTHQQKRDKFYVHLPSPTTNNTIPNIFKSLNSNR
eukprot:TRINITY_DN27010_c0_g1_i1.p1 TRINITY_DN27010_c0_g1~~TRINITY_DN27010_c0_g1_i1.p1  ORF type:complete len:592 (+),score=212.60 TRINITY_DN27010_c0_g1_i1:149-1924(+)